MKQEMNYSKNLGSAEGEIVSTEIINELFRGSRLIRRSSIVIKATKHDRDGYVVLGHIDYWTVAQRSRSARYRKVDWMESFMQACTAVMRLLAL
uniref:Uncharacterized protein n=1 Tax=Parascaris equorum TaxID=6256 RepID=A0A914RFD2_PAREQ